ncbi:hypothetical protein P872_10910 [Rhodonellum psychrophilum GCM71 = DSM 17998]|uniref:Uncharacterized protein n=1 Tax=Rhodonellum psychrophilum GCM71 = DSM 17998 TaxID=1123057 RepID=U5BWH0_9BACT|nr:hypothetical protein P872_10910 [Rhodonellum psychrophilum GCM71 = DSM 17998]
MSEAEYLYGFPKTKSLPFGVFILGQANLLLGIKPRDVFVYKFHVGSWTLLSFFVDDNRF